MRDFGGERSSASDRDDQATAAGPGPGKRTLTEQLPATSLPVPREADAVVQRKADAAPAMPTAPRPSIADLFGRRAGLLPSTGREPDAAPRPTSPAHPGGNAPASAQDLGVRAYATVDHVVFDQAPVQRKAAASAPAAVMSTEPAARAAPGPSRSDGGSPLDPILRPKMERAFGADLSDVRVHEGSADATDMKAAAFTQGSHIHFAPGHHDPSSQAGQSLYGHEIAHVLQQRSGRVAGLQSKGDVLNTDAALEAEADHLGDRAARGERVTVPGAPAQASGTLDTPVRQAYLLYNPGVPAMGVTNYAASLGNQFEGQDKVGSSFMNTPLVPLLNNAPAPALRISANGALAIEDAALANRQPKQFYADPALVGGWNDTLEAQGSFYRIVPVGGETVTFHLGAGGARTLTKMQAQNLEQGNQGTTMTTAQRCDETVQEVTGSKPLAPTPTLQNPMATPLPAHAPTVQTELQHYYIADELAGVSATGRPHGPAIPATGIDFANPNPMLESSARNYGTAMDNHRRLGHDGALHARMQHLGVNEYAVPEVGQGLVTHRLGTETPTGPMGAPQVHDDYNYDPVALGPRVINNPGNHNLWRFHWGGVIAKDGADYITLENYARNAEDAHLPLSATDPRFYFQMYGPGAQSWHERWSALGGGAPGVRDFANPLTMVVSPEDNPTAWNNRAERNYDYATVKDSHNTVAPAASADQLTIALLKALNYANAHINGTGKAHNFADWDRLNAWRAAVDNEIAAPRYPTTNNLLTYVQQQLAQLKRNPISKIKTMLGL